MLHVESLKQALRARRDSKNPLVRLPIAATFTARECLSAAVTASIDARYRSILFLKLFRSRDLHQTTVLTCVDRYPAIFAACKRYFGDKADLNILSFGCSTGEEVLTLRHYFPSAIITGAEINTRSLAQCRKLAVDHRVDFVRSDPDAIRRRAPFDAIFCMAVLQRTPHIVEEQQIKSLKRIYPFEKFDRQVSQFDHLLKTGGLLVLHHSQYLFRDASAATNYQTLQGVSQQAPALHRFDRNSNRMEGATSNESVFIKVS